MCTYNSYTYIIGWFREGAVRWALGGFRAWQMAGNVPSKNLPRLPTQSQQKHWGFPDKGASNE
jgi:hypothetical protein